MPERETNWTIENELCRLSGISDWREALVALQIVDPDESIGPIETVDAWYPAGAETYLYTFRIHTEANVRHLALKACVRFSPGGSIDGIIDEWIARRRALSGAGVSTPRLYSYGMGVILEEYIEHDLATLVKDGAIELQKVLDQLIFLAGVLRSLRFTAVAPFKDLRSRGSDIVAVDFGEDLGPADTLTGGDTYMIRHLRDYLHRKCAIPISDEFAAEIEERLRRRVTTTITEAGEPVL